MRGITTVALLVIALNINIDNNNCYARERVLNEIGSYLKNVICFTLDSVRIIATAPFNAKRNNKEWINNNQFDYLKEAAPDKIIYEELNSEPITPPIFDVPRYINPIYLEHGRADEGIKELFFIAIDSPQSY